MPSSHHPNTPASPSSSPPSSPSSSLSYTPPSQNSTHHRPTSNTKPSKLSSGSGINQGTIHETTTTFHTSNNCNEDTNTNTKPSTTPTPTTINNTTTTTNNNSPKRTKYYMPSKDKLHIYKHHTKMRKHRKSARIQTKHHQNPSNTFQTNQYEDDDDDESAEYTHNRYQQVNWFEEGLEGCSTNQGIGDSCLWDAMPPHEVSELVGWATHLGYPTTAASTTTSNTTTTTTSSSSSYYSNRTNRKRHQCTHHHPGVVPSVVTPWIPTPAPPPPKPSHLLFVSQCASRKLEQTMEMSFVPVTMSAEEEERMETTHTTKTKSKTNDTDGGFVPNFLSDSDEDSTYRSCFRSFTRTTNESHSTMSSTPNHHHNTPIPNTTQTNPKDQSSTSTTPKDKKQQPPIPQINETTTKSNTSRFLLGTKILQESDTLFTMDETALVAVGTMIEEAMIAMMLPLAQKHVAYCRQLERNEQAGMVRKKKKKKEEEKEMKETKKENGSCSETSPPPPLRKKQRISKESQPQLHSGNILENASSFVQWTLPPVYAVSSLIGNRSLGRSYLPSTLPPTLQSSMVRKLSLWKKIPKKQTESSTHGEGGGTMVKVGLDGADDDGAIRLQREAINHWCNMHGFDMDFISKNTDVFRLFFDPLVLFDTN